MTASATTSSVSNTQAQTKNLSQSHLQHFNQSALFHIQQNAIFQQQKQQQSSPTMSCSSVSSPTPSTQQHYFHQSSQQQHQHQNMYSMDQQEQQHHHMQILGNHPASPASSMFLEMPADPFMPVRGGNFLFAENDSSMMNGAEHHLLQYTSAPVAEDCQASHEYMYSQQPSIKSEFSNEHFAAMAPNYMMSMARSLSDSQLSHFCGPAVSGVASTVVKTEMSESPLMYAQQGFYENNSYSNNNIYSNQNHHHHHSYSTSSLSTLSDSSMSPRSNFSSSNNSISSYPLSRTLSEPLFHQGMVSNSSSMSDLAKIGNESDVVINSVKPTPKRSRGRRVSNHPDNSGCKVFTCRVDDCGKVFKRSEHLKRHVRSIHTLEKPFPCPIHNCPKRFSRSDNLNQHIRIHRHNSSRCSATEKVNKEYSSFTPFIQTYSTDLISL
ncbi:zf-C2H2 Zinc finger, C2H2 type [Entomortierella lignicola]|nr:zf-C2H2 Zinc finger, C2H2 type [Entomortierella lignicola]